MSIEEILKGESQSLSQCMCGICLFVRLTENNTRNTIDVSSIYGSKEEHNIVIRIPYLIKMHNITLLTTNERFCWL